MNLQTLLDKRPDAILLREIVALITQRQAELGVEGLTSAGHDERSAGEINYRNGYRDSGLGRGVFTEPGGPTSSPPAENASRITCSSQDV